MSKPRPKFLDSPYFVSEVDNWHLKDGAPESVRREFEDYMNQPDCIDVSGMNESEFYEKFYSHTVSQK